MNPELIMELEMINQKSREIEEKLQMVGKQLLELQGFSEHLDSIENSKESEMLAPLGKGVFIKAEIKDKKFFIDVGSGILIKKDAKKTKETVEDQIKRLGEIRIQLSLEGEGIKGEMNKVVQKAEDAEKRENDKK